jgi:hypothetical protein
MVEHLQWREGVPYVTKCRLFLLILIVEHLLAASLPRRFISTISCGAGEETGRRGTGARGEGFIVGVSRVERQRERTTMRRTQAQIDPLSRRASGASILIKHTFFLYFLSNFSCSLSLSFTSFYLFLIWYLFLFHFIFIFLSLRGRVIFTYTWWIIYTILVRSRCNNPSCYIWEICLNNFELVEHVNSKI